MSVERQRSNTDGKHAGLFKPFIIISKRNEFYLLRWDLQFNRAKPITCENWASFTRNSDHCVTHLLFFFSLEQTRRHLEVVVETTARKPEPPAKIRIVSERHTYPEAPGRIFGFCATTFKQRLRVNFDFFTSKFIPIVFQCMPQRLAVVNPFKTTWKTNISIQ